MGREVRRVPASWEHPKREHRDRTDYLPMHNENFHAAAQEWIASCQLWAAGKHPDQLKYKDRGTPKYFWQWTTNPPAEEFYLPYDPTDRALCSHYQVYETVSEGTPVTPAFATPEELVDYLCTEGDFWEQQRARHNKRPVQPYSREAAEQFVKDGWAPSFVMQAKGGKSTLQSGIEAASAIKKQKGGDDE